MAGIGLLIQAWGFVAIGVLLCLLVVFVFLTGLFLRDATDARQLGVMIGGLAMLLVIPLGIAIFVGFVMCVFVPQKSRAQTPMFIALGLAGLQLLFGIVQAIGTGMDSPAIVIVMSGLRFLLGIGQVTCFCLFMKAAATWVRRDDLARTANAVMYGLTIGPVIGVLLMTGSGILAAAVHPIVGLITFVMAGITGLVTIGFWVAQLFLMFRLGTAMKNYP